MKIYILQLMFMSTVINALALIAQNVCRQNEDYDLFRARVKDFLDLLEEESDKVARDAN